MCEESLTCPLCRALVTPEDESYCVTTDDSASRRYRCRCGAVICVEAVRSWTDLRV